MNILKNWPRGGGTGVGFFCLNSHEDVLFFLDKVCQPNCCGSYCRTHSSSYWFFSCYFRRKGFYPHSHSTLRFTNDTNTLLYHIIYMVNYKLSNGESDQALFSCLRCEFIGWNNMLSIFINIFGIGASAAVQLCGSESKLYDHRFTILSIFSLV